MPAVGSPRVLVLLINFNNTTPTYSPAQLHERIFGPGVGSVRDYFDDVSYGQLHLQGEVYGWFTASQGHDYYSPGTYGRGASYYPQNMYRLAEEAVDAAAISGVDFSLYDNDADGEAEAIIILHQGQGGEVIQNTSNIWSDMTAISVGGWPRTYNGVLVDKFVMVPEVNPWGGMVNLGPIAHELGHLMGMIDTYDYDGSSYGVGVYDLMCRGVWGAKPGVYMPDQPVHPSPWQKILLGWITPTVITPANQGLQTLPAFETNPVVLKVPANPADSREYFLLANFTRTGNHADLPSEGLSIWHADDRALFQVERESTGCADIFPRLALEQADGNFDLEDRINWGDTTDFYPGEGMYRSFTGATLPGSKNYACHLSGVAVDNISDPGPIMTAEVWLDRYVSGLSTPDLKILSYQFIPVSGDGDLHFEPGESFQLLLTLVNDGATATGVTATLNPLVFYTVQVSNSNFPNLSPGATAPAATALAATIKSDILTANNNYQFWFSITLRANGGAYSRTQYIYFRVGDPPLLYVDDDDGHYVDNYLRSGLNSYAYFYDTWEVARQGVPSAADLSAYPQVLWVTGPAQPEPLSPPEQTALAGYLDAGGQLLLSSPYLLVNPSPETAAFAQNYLHAAAWLDDRWAVERIQGITNDPISHSSSSFIYTLGWPYFPLRNQTVGLIPGAGAVGSVYNTHDHFTVLRYPEPYTPGPRVIFISYPLESSFNKYNLGYLLRRYLNGLSYQTGEPFVWDVNPASGQLKELNKLLTITGINFQPSTTFSFPRGGITITNQQYVSDRQFLLTIRIAYNARMDYHSLAMQNPGGPTIVVDRYFRVLGPMLPNQKPLADAGPDQAGYRTEIFTLLGSGSDPDYDYPLRYQWTRLQGPTVTLLPSATVAEPSFTPHPSYVGRYVFSLTVYDALNLASDSDTVSVTIGNLPPTADAGPDQSHDRLSFFVLNGAGSSDPENDPLTFQWTQVSGPPVSLLPSDTAKSPFFEPDRPGVYLFSLVVHDGYDLSLGDTVQVTVVNLPPIADAGPDQTNEVFKRITFDAGQSSDPEGDPLVEYIWVQYAGPAVTLNTDDPVHPYFYGPEVGTYTFGLRVFDGYDWSLNEDLVSAEVTPHVNHAPVANAGPDRQGDRLDNFLLDGSASYDPDEEPITYQWFQLEGPWVELAPGDTAAMPTFRPDPDYIGRYLFALIVSDGMTLSPADTVAITVLNYPPVAQAGPDQSGYRGQLVWLDGSSSFDPEGDPLTFQWTQLAGETVSFLPGDTAPAPAFDPPAVGDYLFSLSVFDGRDFSAGDTVRVTILNQAPVADAGLDQREEVLKPIWFDATGSWDPENDPIQQYHWTQYEGFPVSLDTTDPAHPFFIPPRVDIYRFGLRVFDGYDWSLNEDMVIAEALPSYSNPPVADAGPDRQGYRSDIFTLDGSGSYDPDGMPLTYFWTQLEGPGVVLLPGDTVMSPAFEPDPFFVGTYLFSLQVHDGWTLSAADTVTVTVLNHPPLADAGPDQVADTGGPVALDGTASSDLDGDLLFYFWSQISGPAVTLDLSDPARPTFAAETAGNYVFELTVNDGFDASPMPDAVEVIVKSAGNQLPVANAGPDRVVNFYSPAAVQLDGTASYDPEGTLQGYFWILESKPAGSLADLSDPFSPQPTFSDDVPGDYQVSLRVRDTEVWSFKAYATITSADNLDNDGDTVPDAADPDDDNDLMPDEWELAHSLDPLDAADGGLALDPLTDPDNDGLANLHELFNESDPRSPDLTCNPAGCFFLDADGDQIVGGTDLSKLSLNLNGNEISYPWVFPPNGDTQDIDGDGILAGLDISLYRILLNGRTPSASGYPGPMSLLEPAGSLPSVPVGGILRFIAETHSLAYGTPRAGLAVVFEVISGAGLWLGGDGETPARRTLSEYSMLNTPLRESVFSISRDGLEIFFASNRPGGMGGLDLYRAVRNSLNESFGPPVNLSELNTPADETGPSISADRLTLYFAAYNDTNYYDLYSAVRPGLDQPFGPAQPINELNTYKWELHPMPSDDQLRLYFVQWYNTTWQYNLFMAERPSLGSPFGSPVWMANLNTTANESFPFLSPDELTIIFSSDRPATKAGWNLWMATRASITSNFSAPVELSHINTNGHEYDAHLSADGLHLSFSSDGYPGPGETDLWEVTRASTALPFYVPALPGRFDITGPIQGGAGQNAGGRAVLYFMPTSPGLVEIVVSSPADPQRHIPSSAVERIIQVQVP